MENYHHYKRLFTHNRTQNYGIYAVNENYSC